MPKISPYLQEVISIVSTFLRTINQNQIAQKLQNQYPVPQWIKKKNPLLKKGLKKVLKQYINIDQHMLEYYSNRTQPLEKKQSKKNKMTSPLKTPILSPKVTLKKQQKKSAGWMGKFEQPKRLEDLNQFSEQVIQEQVNIPKKQKKEKKIKKKEKKKQDLQSSEMESEEQFKLQKYKQKQKKLKLKKQKESQSQQQSQVQNSNKVQKKKVNPKVVVQQSVLQKVKVKQNKKILKSQEQQEQLKKVIQKQFQNVNNLQTKNNVQSFSQNGYKKCFSRINKDEVGPIPDQLRDNSFYAKAKYGGGDIWGQYGYQKLKDTRGDSFKKTKGKLKNKAFQGSGIDINRVNSIPIL